MLRFVIWRALVTAPYDKVANEMSHAPLSLHHLQSKRREEWQVSHDRETPVENHSARDFAPVGFGTQVDEL